MDMVREWKENENENEDTLLVELNNLSDGLLLKKTNATYRTFSTKIFFSFKFIFHFVHLR